MPAVVTWKFVQSHSVCCFSAFSADQDKFQCAKCWQDTPSLKAEEKRAMYKSQTPLDVGKQC